jgi:hypothetical protein
MLAVSGPSKRKFDLGVWPLEVDPRGHERQPPPLGATDEPLDLVAVKEQLPRTLGVVVLFARRPVRGDVRTAKPDLPALDHRVGIAELDRALAQGLHFASAKLDPALHRFQ